MGVQCLENLVFSASNTIHWNWRKCVECVGIEWKRQKGGRSYLVADGTEDLSQVFRIDVSNDCTDTHPTTFCHSCWTFMHFWRTRETNTLPVDRVFTWLKHTEPECTVRTKQYLEWKLKQNTAILPSLWPSQSGKSQSGTRQGTSQRQAKERHTQRPRNHACWHGPRVLPHTIRPRL